MAEERAGRRDTVRIDGEVAAPGRWSYEDFQSLDAAHQLADLGEVAPGRSGRAVRLQAVLDRVKVNERASYLGLHASRDDFHASIPLDAVRQRAWLVYEKDGAPLAPDAGGPVRLFIPDHEACHTDEIDECANVKFLDHIEFTVDKGFDNRPDDDEAHQKLHDNQPPH